MGLANIGSTAALAGKMTDNGLRMRDLRKAKAERTLTDEEQAEYNRLEIENRIGAVTLALDGILNIAGRVSTKGFQRPLANKTKRYQRRADRVEKLFNYMQNNPEEAELAEKQLNGLLNNENRLKELFGEAGLKSMLGDDVSKIGTSEFDLSRLDWSKADWSKLNRDALNKLYGNMKVTEDGIPLFGHAPRGKKYINARRADAVESLQKTRDTRNMSQREIGQMKDKLIEQGLADGDNVDEIFEEVVGIKDKMKQAALKVEDLTERLNAEIPNRRLDKYYNEIRTPKERRLSKELSDAQEELAGLQTKYERYKSVIDMEPKGLAGQEKALKDAQKTLNRAYAQSGNAFQRHWMLQSGQTPGGRWLPWAKIGTNAGGIGMQSLLKDANSNPSGNNEGNLDEAVYNMLIERSNGGFLGKPNRYDLGGKLLEYAPILMQAGQVLADDLGWTNTPDYTNADMLARRMDNMRLPIMTYEPLHTPKMTYTPVDVNAENNEMRAAHLGQLRSMGALSGGARALADASWQDAIGKMKKSREEQNLDRLDKVMRYNLDIDKQNQAMAQSVEQQNLAAADKYNDRLWNAAIAIAKARQEEDTATEAYHAQNKANFSKLLNDLVSDRVNKERIKQNLIASGEYVNMQPSELAYLGFSEEQIEEARRRREEMEEEKRRGKEANGDTPEASGDTSEANDYASTVSLFGRTSPFSLYQSNTPFRFYGL